MQNDKMSKHPSDEKQHIIDDHAKNQHKEANMIQDKDNVVENYHEQDQENAESAWPVEGNIIESCQGQDEENAWQAEDDVVENYHEQDQDDEEYAWQMEGNIIESYQENQEENPWHVRGNIIESYQQEEEENPWHARRNVVESYQGQDEEDEEQWYADDEDEKTDKHQGVRKILNEQEPQHGSSDEYADHPAEAQQQPQLAFYFNFVRPRNPLRGFVVSAKEQSQASSRPGFISQLWKCSKGFVVSAKGQSQASSRPSFISQLWNRSKGLAVPAKEQSQPPLRPGFISQLSKQLQEFTAAAHFLSIIPFPETSTDANTSTKTNASTIRFGSAYFPLVGLVIALIACLLMVIAFALHLPSLVIAALVVVALVWLTGGLHLDGLMDTCDGLFGGDTRERKLEIMHDSRSGAFGVLGGLCMLILKFAIFASLDLHHLAQALLIVLPLARWAMVLAMYVFPNALPTGLGAAARQTVTRSRMLIAGITSLLIALAVGQLIGLAVWIAGSLAALIIGIWVTYTLSGLTGDIYGAIAEITEIVGLLVLVGMH
jgi:adenosylcobinamide-GDP ribazoletransferase